MAAMQIEGGSSPKGNPEHVAKQMLSELYDQFPKEGQDLPKDQFVNEAFAVLAERKNKPKSNLILPEGL